MAAKLGFEAIKYVLKKVLTKKGVKGIATIPGKAYDMRMGQLTDEMVKKMRVLGYDINKVTEKQVQGLLDSAEALAKQKKPTPESLLRGEKYTDERGRTWDFGTKDRPYPGWKPKIVPKDDLASGGRIGFGPGGLAKGAKWFLNSLKKNVTDLKAGHPRFKVIPAEEQKMLMEGYETFIKRLEAGAEVPKEALEAISKNPQYYKTKKVVRSQDPDLAEVEELIDEKVFGHVRQELKDFETVGRKSNAAGGRVPLMYGGDPGFAFEYGGSWADWHDQHRDQMPVEQYIKTKLPKHRLPFRELQSGGLAYMLGEPTYMKYGAGGSVGHAPWHKPTGQPQPQQQLDTPTPNIATRPDPMKAPRGIPSLAPKNMDPAYMQQQAMQKAMMGQGNTGQGPRTMANAGGRIGYENAGDVEIPEQFVPEVEENLKRKNLYKMLEKYREWKKDYERRKNLAPTQEVAGGGRIGFGLGGIDKGRRAFMKWLAGIMGTGVAAGTGLLTLGKGATKTISKFKGTPNLVVDITKTPNMPEWYIPVIKKVLNKGDDVTDTAATAERQRVHRDILPDGDEVTVTQNIDAQTIEVSVANPKAHYLSQTGAGETPYTIQYSKGQVIDSGKMKGQKTPDTLQVDEPYVRQAGPDTKDVEIEFDVMDYNPKAEVHDTSVLETYATGKKVKPRGTGKVSDPYEGYSPDLKADDYAKGGLAGLLGE